MSHTLVDDAIWARLAPLIPRAASGEGIGVDHAPKNAVYQYHLGLAAAKIGLNEEAREALLLDPQFDGSADAQRMLTGLKE
jgi:hypothetical protein